MSVLLVEDHPVTRLGLRSLLDSQPDLHVVAEADSVASALALVVDLRPRLVVLPLRLEGELKGIELCRELVAMSSGPRVLVYTSYNSAEDATAAFLSGAHSYVHKGEDVERLLDTVRATAAGRRVWLLGPDPAAGERRLEHEIHADLLTRREKDVLGLMLQRLTNAEIAASLHVELATVKTHVSNLLAKLGLKSRRELF